MKKKKRPNHFILVAIVAGIGLAVYTSSRPFKVYQQEKAKANDMRSELTGLQKNNLKSSEKDQLMNPVQKEEEARRMGYVRPDETPLSNKSEKPKEEPAPKQSSPETPAAQPIELKESEGNEGLR